MGAKLPKGTKRCGEITKSTGTVCGRPVIRGKDVCGGHDPETLAKAQAAAQLANRGFLSRPAAEKGVDFATRATVKATLERLARHAVCGELDAKAVGAAIHAANAALGVMRDEDSLGKRRAEGMTDEELEAAIHADRVEWIKRQEKGELARLVADAGLPGDAA